MKTIFEEMGGTLQRAYENPCFCYGKAVECNRSTQSG